MVESSLLTKIRERSARKMDRYPELFSEISSKSVDKKSILSYGCGFGEELITLEKYFKLSDITGVDISEKARFSCADKISGYKNIFIKSVDDLLLEGKKFDIVFALNVFKRLRSEYSFQEYSSNLSDVSEFVKSGGLFVLDGIQYDFENTDLFKNEFTIFNMDCDSSTNKSRHSYNHYVFRKK